MSDSVPNSKRETITLHELLERSAESALELQREDGSFPPGRNYTYDEPETPVRTTSHWTVTLSEVYDITGKDKFREAANAAVDYLLDDEVRPHGYTYYCRDAPGKDHCNGLVGQAGPIRALARAGPILERQDAIDTAEEVFMMHPFDEELGLWERVEINGENLSFDRTLNHQIIFANAAAPLADKYSSINNSLTSFLDGLMNNFHTHSDGLIQHYIRPKIEDVGRAVLRGHSNWTLAWNELAIRYHYYMRHEERRQKEIGYQTINLRSLGPLKQRYESHPLWMTKKIDQAVEYVTTSEHHSIVNNVDAGATIPGILAAFSLLTIAEKNVEDVTHLIEDDLRRRLDTDSFLLTSDLTAPSDQASSIWVLVEFPNMNLNIST